MRFGTVSVSRAAFYDRTPLGINNSVNTGGVAPHGNTTRFTYTVPANRKAQVGGCQVRATRFVAAGAAGTPTVDLNYTPSGGGTKSTLDGTVVTNNVGDTSQATNSEAFVMAAGDALAMVDSDNSTTGQVIFFGCITATEFDA